jgi:hypothetical protein
MIFAAIAFVGAAVGAVVSVGNVGGSAVVGGGLIVVPVGREEDSQALRGSSGLI